MDQKYISILKNIYNNSTSRVKLEKRGDLIKIEQGVCQGDPISPKIFIAVLEKVFKNLNDIVLFDETAKGLKELNTGLYDESSKVWLGINTEKTKIMTNGQQA